VKNFSSDKLTQALLSWLRSLLLSTIIIPLAAIEAKAAERIYFNYGALGFSVSINSLEQFAKHGTVNKELAFYLERVTPQQREQFRQALLQRSTLDALQVYRFFKTPMGEDILEGIGNLIQIEGGLNGKYPLRGAIFQAAIDAEGLTLLNFLKKFPTNIQLNTEEIFTLAEKVEAAIALTNSTIETVAQLAAKEVKTEKAVDFAKLPDLREPGALGFREQKLILIDKKRNRELVVYLYTPQKWRPRKTPVIIFSHGLASRPEDFSKRGEHLASHGYVVVLPRHPGSDLIYLQETLEGYSSDIFDINEFTNRPLDISFIIDELEKRNRPEFGGRLDLQQVGIAGHSFGGYTALALAGARIDFENLQGACNSGDWDPNLSLLLQCRALELPRKDYNFRDERVKAVLAINPVNSSIFGFQGLSQIQIPVFIVAGSYDPATPAVYEQLRSFPWLTVQNKYLALAEGQAHVDFSVLDAGASQLLNSLPNLTLPDPVLLDSYANAMTLAFFETYIANNSKSRPYLQASYATYLSRQEPFKLYLIDASSALQLSQALNKFNLND
jgi:predicted dienelactone hydrolase